MTVDALLSGSGHTTGRGGLFDGRAAQAEAEAQAGEGGGATSGRFQHKDAIDSDEKAIIKALEDEREAAKAASVYESDPKRREALEARWTKRERSGTRRSSTPCLL